MYSQATAVQAANRLPTREFRASPSEHVTTRSAAAPSSSGVSGTAGRMLTAQNMSRPTYAGTVPTVGAKRSEAPSLQSIAVAVTTAGVSGSTGALLASETTTTNTRRRHTTPSIPSTTSAAAHRGLFLSAGQETTSASNANANDSTDRTDDVAAQQPPNRPPPLRRDSQAAAAGATGWAEKLPLPGLEAPRKPHSPLLNRSDPGSSRAVDGAHARRTAAGTQASATPDGRHSRKHARSVEKQTVGGGSVDKKRKRNDQRRGEASKSRSTYVKVNWSVHSPGRGEDAAGMERKKKTTKRRRRNGSLSDSQSPTNSSASSESFYYTYVYEDQYGNLIAFSDTEETTLDGTSSTSDDSLSSQTPSLASREKSPSGQHHSPDRSKKLKNNKKTTQQSSERRRDHRRRHREQAEEEEADVRGKRKPAGSDKTMPNARLDRARQTGSPSSSRHSRSRDGKTSTAASSKTESTHCRPHRTQQDVAQAGLALSTQAWQTADLSHMERERLILALRHAQHVADTGAAAAATRTNATHNSTGLASVASSSVTSTDSGWVSAELFYRLARGVVGNKHALKALIATCAGLVLSASTSPQDNTGSMLNADGIYLPGMLPFLVRGQDLAETLGADDSRVDSTAYHTPQQSKRKNGALGGGGGTSAEQSPLCSSTTDTVLDRQRRVTQPYLPVFLLVGARACTCHPSGAIASVQRTRNSSHQSATWLLFADDLVRALPSFPLSLLFSVNPNGEVGSTPPASAVAYWHSWSRTPDAVRAQPYDTIWSVISLYRFTVLMRVWQHTPFQVLDAVDAAVAGSPTSPQIVPGARSEPLSGRERPAHAPYCSEDDNASSLSQRHAPPVKEKEPNWTTESGQPRAAKQEANFGSGFLAIIPSYGASQQDNCELTNGSSSEARTVSVPSSTPLVRPPSSVHVYDTRVGSATYSSSSPNCGSLSFGTASGRGRGRPSPDQIYCLPSYGNGSGVPLSATPTNQSGGFVAPPQPPPRPSSATSTTNNNNNSKHVRPQSAGVAQWSRTATAATTPCMPPPPHRYSLTPSASSSVSELPRAAAAQPTAALSFTPNPPQTPHLSASGRRGQSFTGSAASPVAPGNTAQPLTQSHSHPYGVSESDELRSRYYTSHVQTAVPSVAPAGPHGLESGGSANASILIPTPPARLHSAATPDLIVDGAPKEELSAVMASSQVSSDTLQVARRGQPPRRDVPHEFVQLSLDLQSPPAANVAPYLTFPADGEEDSLIRSSSSLTTGTSTRSEGSGQRLRRAPRQQRKGQRKSVTSVSTNPSVVAETESDASKKTARKKSKKSRAASSIDDSIDAGQLAPAPAEKKPSRVRRRPQSTSSRKPSEDTDTPLSVQESDLKRPASRGSRRSTPQRSPGPSGVLVATTRTTSSGSSASATGAAPAATAEGVATGSAGDPLPPPPTYEEAMRASTAASVPKPPPSSLIALSLSRTHSFGTTPPSSAINRTSNNNSNKNNASPTPCGSPGPAARKPVTSAGHSWSDSHNHNQSSYLIDAEDGNAPVPLPPRGPPRPPAPTTGDITDTMAPLPVSVRESDSAAQHGASTLSWLTTTTGSSHTSGSTAVEASPHMHRHGADEDKAHAGTEPSDATNSGAKAVPPIATSVTETDDTTSYSSRGSETDSLDMESGDSASGSRGGDGGGGRRRRANRSRRSSVHRPSGRTRPRSLASSRLTRRSLTGPLTADGSSQETPSSPEIPHSRMSSANSSITRPYAASPKSDDGVDGKSDAGRGRGGTAQQPTSSTAAAGEQANYYLPAVLLAAERGKDGKGAKSAPAPAPAPAAATDQGSDSEADPASHTSASDSSFPSGGSGYGLSPFLLSGCATLIQAAARGFQDRRALAQQRRSVNCRASHNRTLPTPPRSPELIYPASPLASVPTLDIATLADTPNNNNNNSTSGAAGSGSAFTTGASATTSAEARTMDSDTSPQLAPREPMSASIPPPPLTAFARPANSTPPRSGTSAATADARTTDTATTPEAAAGVTVPRPPMLHLVAPPNHNDSTIATHAPKQATPGAEKETTAGLLETLDPHAHSASGVGSRDSNTTSTSAPRQAESPNNSTLPPVAGRPRHSTCTVDDGRNTPKAMTSTMRFLISSLRARGVDGLSGSTRTAVGGGDQSLAVHTAGDSSEDAFATEPGSFLTDGTYTLADSGTVVYFDRDRELLNTVRSAAAVAAIAAAAASSHSPNWSPDDASVGRETAQPHSPGQASLGFFSGSLKAGRRAIAQIQSAGRAYLARRAIAVRYRERREEQALDNRLWQLMQCTPMTSTAPMPTLTTTTTTVVRSLVANPTSMSLRSTGLELRTLPAVLTADSPHYNRAGANGITSPSHESTPSTSLGAYEFETISNATNPGLRTPPTCIDNLPVYIRHQQVYYPRTSSPLSAATEEANEDVVVVLPSPVDVPQPVPPILARLPSDDGAPGVNAAQATTTTAASAALAGKSSGGSSRASQKGGPGSFPATPLLHMGPDEVEEDDAKSDEMAQQNSVTDVAASQTADKNKPDPLTAPAPPPQTSSATVTTANTSSASDPAPRAHSSLTSPTLGMPFVAQSLPLPSSFGLTHSLSSDPAFMRNMPGTAMLDHVGSPLIMGSLEDSQHLDQMLARLMQPPPPPPALRPPAALRAVNGPESAAPAPSAAMNRQNSNSGSSGGVQRTPVTKGTDSHSVSSESASNSAAAAATAALASATAAADADCGPVNRDSPFVSLTNASSESPSMNPAAVLPPSAHTRGSGGSAESGSLSQPVPPPLPSLLPPGPPPSTLPLRFGSLTSGPTATVAGMVTPGTTAPASPAVSVTAHEQHTNPSYRTSPRSPADSISSHSSHSVFEDGSVDPQSPLNAGRATAAAGASISGMDNSVFRSMRSAGGGGSMAYSLPFNFSTLGGRSGVAGLGNTINALAATSGSLADIFNLGYSRNVDSTSRRIKSGEALDEMDDGESVSNTTSSVVSPTRHDGGYPSSGVVGVIPHAPGLPPILALEAPRSESAETATAATTLATPPAGGRDAETVPAAAAPTADEGHQALSASSSSNSSGSAASSSSSSSLGSPDEWDDGAGAGAAGDDVQQDAADETRELRDAALITAMMHANAPDDFMLDQLGHLQLKPERPPLTVQEACALLQRVGRGFKARQYQRFLMTLTVAGAEIALVQRVATGYRARKEFALRHYVFTLAKKEVALWERRQHAAIDMQRVARGFVARQKTKRLERKLWTRIELRIIMEAPNPDED